jgi:aminopeptidase-like protein
LYPKTGGGINQPAETSTPVTQDLDAITWVLFLADGATDLLTAAERSGLAFDRLVDAADRLLQVGLLQPVSD